MRSIRKVAPRGKLVTLSGADPLNLAGILTPGARVTAIGANRILLRDGVPLVALEADKLTLLSAEAGEISPTLERALRIGAMPASLRRYYA